MNTSTPSQAETRCGLDLCESVAGEEDPGSVIDLGHPITAAARADPSAGREPASEGTPMSPGDEAPPGTPGTGEDVCPDCGGTGKRAGRDCPTCQGTGKVTVGIGGA